MSKSSPGSQTGEDAKRNGISLFSATENSSSSAADHTITDDQKADREIPLVIAGVIGAGTFVFLTWYRKSRGKAGNRK